MRVLSKIRRFLRLSVSLYKGTDFEGTIEGIRKNVATRGSNIWMLICSAILACIGLDTNSTAVIIGAMLISPLMSPILGVGLAVGIQERKLLSSSLRNLALATFVSLSTSIIYFTISPLAQPTDELTARTTPTILDVGVAFFGGIAGIVAGSRKDKTNAVPGVAIATALMPPLCTAGFGLATWRTEYFLGAFYLYFINAVFISFATYAIVLWLGFPRYVRKETDGDTHIKASIMVFVALVVIPSGVIFFNVLKKLRFDRNVRSFVTKELKQNERQPIDWSVSESDGQQTLKVFVVGKPFQENEKELLTEKMKSDYKLRDLRLNLVQMNLSPEEIEKATSAVESSLTDKISFIQSVEESQANEIENLKTEIEILRANTERERFPLDELLKLLFPSIENIRIETASADAENSSENNYAVAIIFKKETAEAQKTEILEKAERISRLKLKTRNVRVSEIEESENQESAKEKVNANTQN